MNDSIPTQDDSVSILTSLSKVKSELDKLNNILDDVIVKCHPDQLIAEHDNRVR